jgi:hypothetical protein
LTTLDFDWANIFYGRHDPDEQGPSAAASPGASCKRQCKHRNFGRSSMKAEQKSTTQREVNAPALEGAVRGVQDCVGELTLSVWESLIS